LKDDSSPEMFFQKWKLFPKAGIGFQNKLKQLNIYTLEESFSQNG